MTIFSTAKDEKVVSVERISEPEEDETLVSEGSDEIATDATTDETPSEDSAE